MVANKYKKLGRRVIVITYMESRFSEDIIQFYKYTSITNEEKAMLD